MKKVLFALAALIALAACENKQKTVSSTENGNDSSEVDVVLSDENEGTYFPAIDQYLAEEIGSQYAKGEFCVPFHSIVGVDERNSEDILVWGDFWVFNYNQVGDTLKCVSGGSHPGLMHIRQKEKGFEVTSFDQVEDGSRYMPTAKKIFGDKFDAFQAINQVEDGSGYVPTAKKIFGDKYDAFQAISSDEQKREKLRADVLATFVKEHNLSATMYQDYGWPAKKLRK